VAAEKLIETDVVIIGGGLAGCLAAIQARQLNVDVTLVDKNFVSRTGDSHITGGMIEIFNPEWGHDFDEWMNYTFEAGEYLIDRDWVEINRRDSYARFRDLVSWGVEFAKDAEGKIMELSYGTGVPIRTLLLHSRTLMPALRGKALEKGVKILDRIFITDLLKQDGRICGAVGFHSREGNFYTFKAKAVVNAAGRCHYKTPTAACAYGTGDSYAMGYRAGAELTSMEFCGRRAPTAAICDAMVPPASALLRLRGGVVNAKGEQFYERYSPKYKASVPSHWLMCWAFEVHAGRGPIYYNYDVLTPEDKKLWKEKYLGKIQGYCIPHQFEQSGIEMTGKVEAKATQLGGAGGLRLINTGCETSLPGLYAAGDSGANNRYCAGLPTTGTALQNAAVAGHRAGQAAAEYALETKKPVIDEKEVARLKEITFMPLRRVGGFSPDCVLERLQYTIIPYDILFIRHGKRLQAALTMVEFFRDHFVPKLWAKDIHDLVKANEIRNMILTAEMMLRSSLFRTESRGEFYREDYPRRDDKNWLAWTVLKEENGEMKLDKLPMPVKWKPDRSLSYRDKYDFWRFPADVDPKEI